MAVPKKKTSPSKRNMRWHGRLTKKGRGVRPISFSIDSVTGELKLPHHMSKSGHYNGKKLLKDKKSA